MTFLVCCLSLAPDWEYNYQPKVDELIGGNAWRLIVAVRADLLHGFIDILIERPGCVLIYHNYAERGAETYP